MEYIISTENFKDAKNFGKIYYLGNFDVLKEHISILEGDLIYESEINNFSNTELLNKTIIGNFNFFKYNKKTNEFILKNDKFGTYSIYLYHTSHKLIISNNVWKIIALLKDTEISINKDYFRFAIGTWETNLDGKTLFNNITELNPATNLTGNFNNISKLKINTYFSLIQNSNSKLTIKEAVDKLDNDLNFTFSRINRNNPNALLGFGNSGGLDSRLIPIYAKQNNIKTKGFTTLNKYPKTFFKSITYLNAKKTAKAYNFENKFINYKFKNYEDRNLLDIRNNPFGTSEMFKNPYDKLPEIDYYVTGGNGFIVGGAWKKIVNIKSDADFLKEFITYNSKFKAFNWTKNGNHFFNFLFDEKYIKFINDSKIRFYEENSYKDKFSIIRSFHQYSLNKRSPAGGFESVNRLYKTYNIYYPIVFENTLNWSEDFFFDRIILKELIKKKSTALYNIPSQNYEKLNNAPLSILGKVNRRFALKYRTWGLDYENWVQDASFLLYSNTIMKRKNPLFYELLHVSEKEFNKFNLFKDVHAHISLDILKLKKILDIFIYKEFDLINNKKFELK